MSETRSFLGRRWVRRVAIGCTVAVSLFAAIGFFVLPPVVRRVAETQLARQLGRRASIARIRINPFALSLTVDNLQIYEVDGVTPFVGFTRLYVNAQLASVYRGAPVVKEVRLEGPHLRVVRVKQTAGAFADLGAYNFSDIWRKLTADNPQATSVPASPPPPSKPGSPPPRFSVNNIRLEGGSVIFEDRPTGEHHEISRLSVGIPFISTLPVDLDTFVKPGLALNLDGTPFSLDGRTKPFSSALETTLELRLQSLDLTRYQSYLSLPAPMKVRLESGRLTVALDLSFVRRDGARKEDAAPLIRLAGDIGLSDVAIRTAGAAGLADAPILKLAKFELKIGRADLTALDFHIDRVLLSGLDVYARRLADGSLDLQRLAPTSQPTPPTDAKTAPPRFLVDELRLEKINLHLRDERVRPTFVETVRDLTVAVKHLSNAPGALASLMVSLRAEPGGTLTQSGTLGLAPFMAAGTVSLDGLEPGRFAPYYREQIAFDVSCGRLKLGTSYRLSTRGGTTAIALVGAFLELDDLALRQRAASTDFLQVGHFAVARTNVDVGGHSVGIGDISSRDVRVRASRNAKGEVDLTTLGAPGGAAPNDRAEKVVTSPARPPADATHAPEPAPEPWTVNVDHLDFENGSARFVDHAVKPDAALAIDGLVVHARTLSTRPGSRANLDVRFDLNKSGAVQVNGTAGASPLTADLRLDLRRIAIVPFQPYFKDSVTLRVTDGALSLKGRVKLNAQDAPRPAGRGGSTAPRESLRMAFTGDLDIRDFGTLDGYKNERLLAWKSLHAGGINLDSQPPSLAIREVTLTDFLTRLMIFPDAHFNLEDIAAKPPGQPAVKPTPTATPPATASTAGKAPAPPRITIDGVTLQGGHVIFTDRLIKPNYTAELTELAGRITGLSAAADTTAAVALRGAVDHSGVLTIDGRMNPLAKQLFLDLAVRLSDFELPPTSPYAARYVGYGIDKGKLGLSLDYHVANGKLDAQNKLILDQFTFGEAVPSPQALHLPVKLAVALLKDRHGVIDIDLPITGSLDDPEFKLSRLILKTLGNLIVKAVTAPFSLIAKAFGGGDEESFLEFDSGGEEVAAKGLAKLRAVAKALHERPGLSFEIEGLADPRTDASALRQRLYERKLRAQKRRSIVESGSAVPEAEQMQITPAERPQLIEAVYRGESFAKPRTPDGREKSLPPPEMEKLSLAAIRVDNDELRQLALRRANAVKEAITKVEPTAAARLFLINPRNATPGNRVELKLKRD